MEHPTGSYWQKRLADLKANLTANNFEVHIAEDKTAAVRMAVEDILEKVGPKRISWGGSKTVIETGLYDRLKQLPSLETLDTYDKSLTAQQSYERRRQALLVDMFFMGTNAVTESGQLVNLDMIGNRVAALTFGPQHVVVLVGRNKIVAGLDEAMNRIKEYAAPVNAMRLKKKTPCAKTSYCEECKSPDRICNTWTITEKSFPKGRVKVILINEDLGF